MHHLAAILLTHVIHLELALLVWLQLTLVLKIPLFLHDLRDAHYVLVVAPVLNDGVLADFVVGHVVHMRNIRNVLIQKVVVVLLLQHLLLRYLLRILHLRVLLRVI